MILRDPEPVAAALRDGRLGILSTDTVPGFHCLATAAPAEPLRLNTKSKVMELDGTICTLAASCSLRDASRSSRRVASASFWSSCSRSPTSASVRRTRLRASALYVRIWRSTTSLSPKRRGMVRLGLSLYRMCVVL